MSAVKHGLRATAVLGGVATSVGLLYLLYNNYQKARSGQLDIPREVAIKVLKELRRELYPVFKKILNVTKSMRMVQRQQRRNRRGPGPDPLADMDKIELCELPEFREAILEVEDRIYAKYSIDNKQIFEKFCLTLQRTDTEVNRIMTEVNDMYAQTKRGDTIRLNFTAPEQITPLAALKAQKEIYFEKLTVLKQSVMSAGAGLESEEEARLAQKRLEEATEAVLRHNGFDVMEEYHAEAVFEQTCIKFMRVNPEFGRKLALIEQTFHNIVNQVFTNRLPIAKAEEEFNRIDRILKLGEPQPVIDVVEPPLMIEEVAPAALNAVNLELQENGLLVASPASLKPNVIDVIELSEAQPTPLFAAVPPAGDFPHPGVRLSQHEESPSANTTALSSTPFEVLPPNQSVDAPFQDLTTSHTDEHNGSHS